MPLTTGGYVEIYPDAAEKVTNTPEARSYLLRVADAALGHAQADAPVLTGAYRASFEAGLMEGDKPEAYLAVGTDYWSYLEFGTIHNRPYRTLTNAMRGQADKYVEDPPETYSDQVTM
jgi:HK97 gp10 family phage protein